MTHFSVVTYVVVPIVGALLVVLPVVLMMRRRRVRAGLSARQPMTKIGIVVLVALLMAAVACIWIGVLLLQS